MAKAKTQAADMRQKLIDDARAKLRQAEEDGRAAKAEFETAENAEAKAAAQTKINAATEAYTRSEAALEALLNLKPKDQETGDDAINPGSLTREFIALRAIRHNGVDYAEGDTIPLDLKSFEQLAAIKAIAWDDDD